MHILITGHKGYIGSAIVPLLAADGLELTGLDNGLFEDCVCGDDPLDIPEIRKDIRDIEPGDLRGFDAIIHLSGLSNDAIGAIDEEVTYDLNVRASVRLARLAKQAGVRWFLHSSSCSVYGCAEDSFVTESCPIDPMTAYARSKALVDDELAHLSDDSFTTAYLRNGVAYGFSARPRLDLVLNNFVATAYTSGRIVIQSDGTPWRPMVHIEDIGRAFLAILRAPRERVQRQAFNIGTTVENYQVRELADIVRQTVPGCVVEYAANAKPDKCSFRVNCDKIQQLLPEFSPRWSVRTGAKQLLEAFRAAGLKASDLQDTRFHRFRRVKWLREHGVLDNQFRRTDEAAYQAVQEEDAALTCARD